MPLARAATQSPLLQKTCLTCGYRGDDLQRMDERSGFRCPGCGQDLYARPPRSYAEMEALPIQPAAPVRAGARTGPQGRRARPSRAWALGRFVAAIAALLRRLFRRRARAGAVTLRHRASPSRR